MADCDVSHGIALVVAGALWRRRPMSRVLEAASIKPSGVGQILDVLGPDTTISYRIWRGNVDPTHIPADNTSYRGVYWLPPWCDRILR